ncbi:rRNA pseudouridine synthase [Candidatus Parcubacteria bacterium]|nr:MAG: rRNA pseudouridine synthase [Candidatus Parcubacteria bacterium]
MGEIRLQKYLADSGVASRRKAEELIRQGRVVVNGTKVVSMGHKVTESDSIEVDGREIRLKNSRIYVMLNKPAGYVTTVKDQFSRKTVTDLLPEISERIYPVGRLDYDTSGLLILTNDGDFAYMLTHPKHEIDKVYVAEVKGHVTDEDIRIFEQGIRIEDYTTSPSQLKIIKKGKESSTIEIIIHEGKNRQVRKMCEAIGHPVIALKRTAIGKLMLGKLTEGKWRYLSEEEVKLF